RHRETLKKASANEGDLRFKTQPVTAPLTTFASPPSGCDYSPHYSRGRPLLLSCCKTRRGNEPAVGTQVPHTKKRPRGTVPFTSRAPSHWIVISGGSGDLPPPPPGEKTTASQDQAGQTCASDGAGNSSDGRSPPEANPKRRHVNVVIPAQNNSRGQ